MKSAILIAALAATTLSVPAQAREIIGDSCDAIIWTGGTHCELK